MQARCLRSFGCGYAAIGWGNRDDRDIFSIFSILPNQHIRKWLIVSRVLFRHDRQSNMVTDVLYCGELFHLSTFRAENFIDH
jgi:hypothetical protein